MGGENLPEGSRYSWFDCFRAISCQCPNSIGIAAVMDALRQLAVREGVPTSEKEIYRFHRYVYKSIRRHGRLNKLEAMIRFKVGSGDIFADMPAGYCRPHGRPDNG